MVELQNHLVGIYTQTTHFEKRTQSSDNVLIFHQMYVKTNISLDIWENVHWMHIKMTTFILISFNVNILNSFMSVKDKRYSSDYMLIATFNILLIW